MRERWGVPFEPLQAGQNRAAVLHPAAGNLDPAEVVRVDGADQF
ncbi:MAG TPA: hypothetical protein VKA59_27855 [Vicinamibacterales bacterium]|nr:hypothetical protein [Vicinamibacterales bacterium]